jgi:hypothetical protein
MNKENRERNLMKKISAKTGGSLWVVLTVLVIFLILIAVGVKYNRINLDLKDVMGIMNDKLELLSRMRITLLKSVEAEMMAVMADTDEASRANAEESKKAADFLEKERLELGLLIKKDATDQERKLFQEFDHCWTEFRKIDQVLLDFAVKNTNIKAANLSFAKGSEAVQDFEAALQGLISDKPSNKEEIQMDLLVFKALVAAIKIHYLHAPHIAAANDDQMDKIEKEIKQNEAIISQSLDRLTPLVLEKNRSSLSKARKAYDELSKVTAQVIDLSRQNTNIISFELSLGRKRKITAQCDEILSGLQEAVRSTSFKATR